MLKAFFVGLQVGIWSSYYQCRPLRLKSSLDKVVCKSAATLISSWLTCYLRDPNCKTHWWLTLPILITEWKHPIPAVPMMKFLILLLPPLILKFPYSSLTYSYIAECYLLLWKYQLLTRSWASPLTSFPLPGILTWRHCFLKLELTESVWTKGCPWSTLQHYFFLKWFLGELMFLTSLHNPPIVHRGHSNYKNSCNLL